MFTMACPIPLKKNRKFLDKNKDRLYLYYKERREGSKRGEILTSKKRYRELNKEKIKTASKKYYEENKEKINNYHKRQEVKDRNNKRNRNRYSKDPDYKEKVTKRNRNNDYKESKRMSNAKRRAAKLKRTPSWLTDKDWKDIKEFYVEADRLTKETGVPHHVDHIIPLQGEFVSGLHVPSNLQVITASENSSKGIKVDLKELSEIETKRLINLNK